MIDQPDKGLQAFNAVSTDELIAVRACSSHALRQRFIGRIAFQRINPGDGFGATGQRCHLSASSITRILKGSICTKIESGCRVALNGSYINITSQDSGEFRAYLTVPQQGSGPGLVLLQEIFGVNAFMRTMADRFAEEGYVCLVPDLFWRIEPGTDLDYDATDIETALQLRSQYEVNPAVVDIVDTVRTIRNLDVHAGKVGCLGYCMGGLLAYLSAARLDVDCAISYYGVGIENYLNEMQSIGVPCVLHLGVSDAKVPAEAREAIETSAAAHANVTTFTYPDCGHAFANPARDNFDKLASMMAYSRTLAALRREMGPIYDLSYLWERHTEYEFATRDVAATMATMVDEPYVNHVPTMTGGVGHDDLKQFYKDHFVNSNPPDTRLIPVSRTVGADRLVDEMILCFTHSCEIPWMLPGIEATGKYVEIPLVAIVNFRGDKLYHEHIYWDQASVLVQIGKLNPDGLPVAGGQTAKKLISRRMH